MTTKGLCGTHISDVERTVMVRYIHSGSPEPYKQCYTLGSIKLVDFQWVYFDTLRNDFYAL